MSPFRFSRPRALAQFTLEGGLIFAVLYGLANLTLAGLPYLVHGDLSATSAATTLASGACLYATRRRGLGDEPNPGREFALVCLFPFFPVLLPFSPSWSLSASRRTCRAS